MNGMRWCLVMAGMGTLSALAGCVKSETTRIADFQTTPKPKGCPVRIFPSTTPDYPWKDVATVEAVCPPAFGRSACIEELKEQTCKEGGDTLYGFKDDTNTVIGTVAIKTGDGQLAKSGGTPAKAGEAPAAEPGACDPPCSPGFKCDAGQCLAVCNPPCETGFRCNQQRTCEAEAK